jgi:hypothetical protein
MPNKKVDYLNTVIYNIVCKDLTITDVYVGHTTDFRSRKSHHKRNCCNPNYRSHHLKVYEYIRSNGGWDNFEMLEIEKYPCGDANEARSRERYWYEVKNAKLNDKYPARTKEEYYADEDNKKHKQETDKIYRDNNQEKITEYRKEHYIKNAEVIRQKVNEWRIKNVEKAKETKKLHYEANKEEILSKQREWYALNKEARKEKNELNKEKIKRQRKEYREKNKEKISNAFKEKYQLNKEKISKAWKEKYALNKEKMNERQRELRRVKKEQKEQEKINIVNMKI